MSKQLQISLKTFNLISSTIQSTLNATGHVRDINTSCTFFACFGAGLLSQVFKVKCRAVAGRFLLRHPDGEHVMAFASNKNDRFGASGDGFHMWVQTETHIIDFMSPLYPEVFGSFSSDRPLERHMIQLPFSKDAQSQKAFENGLPLMTLPDAKLTEETIDLLASSVSTTDLMRVVLDWGRQLRRNPKCVCHITDEKGEMKVLRLNGRMAKGAW